MRAVLGRVSLFSHANSAVWKYADKYLSVTELLSGHCHSKGHLQELLLSLGAFA